MTIRSAHELDQCFEQLACGDVVMGHLPSKYQRPALVADFLERGIRCVPSALCQLISRSKCAQAILFRQWMMPHTLVIARRAELMDAVTYCARNRIGELVTKQEGMHCGHGIRRWDSAETLYNTVAFTDSVYPFVLQPFQTDIADVRVIVVGDYVEAYLRENLFNFRANLAAGGVSRPLAIDPAAEDICRKVMSRGRFPYGHIDLHLSAGGMVWLSEITLDGGIVAARIGRKELQRRKQEVLERLAEMESGSELKDTSKQGGIP